MSFIATANPPIEAEDAAERLKLLLVLTVAGTLIAMLADGIAMQRMIENGQVELAWPLFQPPTEAGVMRVDQGHGALVHVVLGEEGFRHRGEDIHYGVADAQYVVGGGLGHHGSPLRHQAVA